MYVAAAVPAGIVRVPLALIVRPAMPPFEMIVGVTSAGAKAAPFNVSLVNTAGVLPPARPFTGEAVKSSSTASTGTMK